MKKNLKNDYAVLFACIFLVSLFSCKHKKEDASNTEVKQEAKNGLKYEMVTVVESGSFLEIAGKNPPHIKQGDKATYGAFPEWRGRVRLSPYSIGKYEVDYKLWYEVRTKAESMGYVFANKGMQGDFSEGGKSPDYKAVGKIPTEPSHIPSDDSDRSNYFHPVTMISWRDAIIWCNAYNEILGLPSPYILPDGTVAKDATIEVRDGAFKYATVDTVVLKDEGGYRLATEAEWEVSARGANPALLEAWNYKYAGGDNISIVAWVESNSQDRTHERGRKSANTLDIYDMSGNVSEWCFDSYAENVASEDDMYKKDGFVKNPQGKKIKENPKAEDWSKILRCFRGGSFFSDNDYCTTSTRNNNSPYQLHNGLGFRLAKSIK